MADLRPFPHSDPAPAPLRRAGRRDGGIDVGLDRNRHGPDHLAAHRTAHLLARFARTLDVGTGDEQPDVTRILDHRASIQSAGPVPGARHPARSAGKIFAAERAWCVPSHQPAWTGSRATSRGPTRTRLRRSITAVTITAARVTPSMIVARALTAGVRPNRTAEYSTIGQVLVVPFVNAGST